MLTVAGRVMPRNWSQPANAAKPIVSRLAGSVTVDNFLPKKAVRGIALPW